ncbi:MAG: hypothetical protein U1F36_04655 [Planctomycetota bacterium]
MTLRFLVSLAVVTAASLSAQEGADSGLGFLDAQRSIALQFGVEHSGLLGLAVDGAGHFWVSARRPTSADPHRIFELDRQGNLLGTFAAPSATAGSAFGLRDGTYDPATNRIYWGIDPAGAPQSNVYAFDVATRQFTAAHDIHAQVLTTTIRGLAFDGSRFWTADFAGPITAFDGSGTQVAAFASPSDTVYGLAFHPQRGTLWLASQTGLGDATTQGGPNAPGVHLLEMDPLTGALTGNRFRADYLLPFGTTGVSGGAAIQSRGNGFVIDVLVQGAPHDGIVELIVDSEIGVGCGGLHLAYAGGNAFAGNNNFTLTLAGANPQASCAMLIGFDTLTSTIPGITSCPLMTNFAGAYGMAGSGSSRSLALPVPVDVPPIGIGFQVLQFNGAFPLDLSQLLWISLVP